MDFNNTLIKIFYTETTYLFSLLFNFKRVKFARHKSL